MTLTQFMEKNKSLKKKRSKYMFNKSRLSLQRARTTNLFRSNDDKHTQIKHSSQAHTHTSVKTTPAAPLRHCLFGQ